MNINALITADFLSTMTLSNANLLRVLKQLSRNLLRLKSVPYEKHKNHCILLKQKLCHFYLHTF